MNLERLNRARAIERLAESVLVALGCKVPPIDVAGIARVEGILLAESDFGSDFFGRIEYHAGVRRFILYHSTLIPTARNYWQTRFSIAHELGHYYIPEHRRLLIAGKLHWSEPGFVCDNVMEREADLFASALLIPESVVDQLWSRKALSLQSILRGGNICETSGVSAGIRAARSSEECVVVILSKDRDILFVAASDEARARHLGWINIRRVPNGSPSEKAHANSSKNHIFESTGSLRNWYPESSSKAGCWEEAMRLGATNFVLTLLVIDDEEDEED
jgi:hypothetical protein